ncbi:hypothetical protein ABW17_20770 [Mycobacterium nebraskense]|uniref:hypothetical protein n=1 Tax=Mycobacterium nebraskense TaxID=244292 RepID=UPI00064214C5|nr:hypothetical protein [Mycobacterium nebraskense]KLO38780.1 hypothetical protein ABW17_20770 [Mycobacterium nebraskense]
MINTQSYRDQIGLALTDEQVVLAIRLVCSHTDPDPHSKFEHRRIIRDEWKGRHYIPVDGWAEDLVNSFPIDQQEQLRDDFFAILERAIPPRSHG